MPDEIYKNFYCRQPIIIKAEVKATIDDFLNHNYGRGRSNVYNACNVWLDTVYISIERLANTRYEDVTETEEGIIEFPIEREYYNKVGTFYVTKTKFKDYNTYYVHNIVLERPWEFNGTILEQKQHQDVSYEPLNEVISLMARIDKLYRKNLR